MSLKTKIASTIISRLLRPERLVKKRRQAEKKRQAQGRPHEVIYFHQTDDPYSYLMSQALPSLIEGYDIQLTPCLVSPPPDWAAPERGHLEAYSRLDAERLAKQAGLSFQDPGHQPDYEWLADIEATLSAHSKKADFLDKAKALSANLWAGTRPPECEPAIKGHSYTAAGDSKRNELGHYLGATCYYEGEWYWGIDRLHYLEERLAPLCANTPAPPPIFRPPEVSSRKQTQEAQNTPEIDFYLSFRSPYTYIAIERIKRLADAYGAELRYKYVLPMVMRNLPVPRLKGTYILGDVAREAHRQQVPFGRIADPVGRPVERGYSLLPWALGQGRGYEYCLSFMRNVWSRGVNAGSDKGLALIVAEAGLDWAEGKGYLGNENWRQEAEANRKELLSLGVWGVPSFRGCDTTAWGQDRLWVIENALKARLQQESKTAPDEST